MRFMPVRQIDMLTKQRSMSAGASEYAAYAVGLDEAEFQLAVCGDVLQRDVPADRDPRVLSFNPDPWQRKVCRAFILKSQH